MKIGSFINPVSSIFRESLIWVVLLWVVCICGSLEIIHYIKMYVSYTSEKWTPSHNIFIYITTIGCPLILTVVYFGYFPEKLRKIITIFKKILGK